MTKLQDRSYKTIKWVLKQHIKNNKRTLWTYKDNEFKCIYKNYDVADVIYTPGQLLDKIESNEI
tara:strand:+ start:1871 stop:2062 length:192 start_codon:yes stop_codon:yes gene_type:complete